MDLFRIQFTRFLKALIEMADQQLDIDGIWERMLELSRGESSVKEAETATSTESSTFLGTIGR
ncbi:MAG TPA: hypothetical protein DDW93_07285 [Firmicutes bacterium]|nr:hypothetical protein [Bacillota bacterium]